MLFGIDAHADYQPTLSPDKAKAEGYSFLVAKATEGTRYVAPQKNFDWMKRSRDIGLITGAYHFLRAGSGIDQAHYFLGTMTTRVGGVNGLLIQADCEGDNTFQTLVDFVNEVKRAVPGKTVLVYSGKWWWDQKGRDGGSALGPLWDSHYVSGTGYGSVLYQQVPALWWGPRYGGWNAPTILQFTSKGTAAGVIGNLDLNAYRGTLAELASLAGTRAPDGDDDMTWNDREKADASFNDRDGNLDTNDDGKGDKVFPNLARRARIELEKRVSTMDTRLSTVESALGNASIDYRALALALLDVATERKATDG